MSWFRIALGFVLALPCAAAPTWPQDANCPDHLNALRKGQSAVTEAPAMLPDMPLASGRERLAKIETRFAATTEMVLGSGLDGVVLLLKKRDGSGYLTVKAGKTDLRREHAALRAISRKLADLGESVPFPEVGEYDADTNSFASAAIGSHDLTGRQPIVPARSLLQLQAARPPVVGPGQTSGNKLIEQGLRDAVKRIHSAGYVHRDIKPANILITQDADNRIHVWLVDFSIALPVKEAPPGRATEGTPDYRAPGQTRGDPAAFDHDWHSVDRVLRELSGEK